MIKLGAIAVSSLTQSPLASPPVPGITTTGIFAPIAALTRIQR